MNNHKFQIQKFTKQNKKIKVKKQKVKKTMLLNIKYYSKSSHIYKLDQILKLNKSKHKLGLKYFSYPTFLNKDKTPNYICINVDIIDNDLTSNNLLKIVRPDSNREITCDNPDFYNINDSYINKIKITYLDENGRFIKFEPGYMFLVLEIIEI